MAVVKVGKIVVGGKNVGWWFRVSGFGLWVSGYGFRVSGFV